jgi:hypothetical protein
MPFVIKRYRSIGFQPVALLALALMLALSASDFASAEEEWIERSPKRIPTGRDDHVMAFHEELGLVVMFGGDNASSYTWLYDGINWTRFDDPGSPAPRRESVMAYDSHRKLIVLFGGFDYVIENQTTWEFDGEKWKGRIPASSPDGRSDHAMAYDAERRQMIMFGGEGIDEDTWAYAEGKWRTVNREGNTPGERGGHGMVYDSDRKVIVLFGGNLGGDFYNDTWEWDGERWRDVTPAGTSPPGMRAFAMVYDKLRKRTVVFGGRDEMLDGFNATWEWDGIRWREIETTTAPPARHECAAAYDSVRHRMVLFGGSAGEGPENRFMNDTWWYPNNPPAIFHDPVLGAFPGADVEINAELLDYDSDTEQARLFWRNSGETEYLSFPMKKIAKSAAADTAGETTEVVGTIDGGDISEDGFEYYIRSTDPDGSRRYIYNGTAEAPYPVSIGDVGAISIFIKPKNARKRGAMWRPAGTKEWQKSGATVRGLTPGDLGIEFKSIEKFNKPKDFTVLVIHGKKSNYTVEYTPKVSSQ